MDKDTKTILIGQPIISQLLSFIPEEIIRNNVSDNKSDRYYKKFKTKDHLVCMLYGVLTKSSTLREICKNILFLGKKLMYCGISNAPKRSTFSDANNKRDSSVFGSIYYDLYAHHKQYLSDSSIKLPINDEVPADKVELFDSTTITLFKEILKGAGRKPVNGKKKGGIKVHTKVNLSENVPDFICFSSGASNDKNFLKVMELPEGSIGVFDKGYHNYAKYEEWNKSGRFYVTRLNDNGKYDVVENLPIGESIKDGVIKDQIIELSYICKKSKEIKKVKARLVTYIDPVKGERLEFLSNLFHTQNLTIALLYQKRWDIEVLFKQLKQNFELKYFLSDSENGIKIQIWVALILNLIFTVIYKMIKETEDFRTMVKIAAKNLCSYVGLIEFLMNPTDCWEFMIRDHLDKMQLSLFDSSGGGSFENSS